MIPDFIWYNRLIQLHVFKPCISFISLPEGFKTWYEVYLNYFSQKNLDTGFQIETMTLILSVLKIDEFHEMIEKYNLLNLNGTLLRDEIWISLWEKDIINHQPFQNQSPIDSINYLIKSEIGINFISFLRICSEAPSFKEKLLILVEWGAINTIKRLNLLQMIKPNDTKFIQEIFLVCSSCSHFNIFIYVLKELKFSLKEVTRKKCIQNAIINMDLDILKLLVKKNESLDYIIYEDIQCILNESISETQDFWSHKHSVPLEFIEFIIDHSPFFKVDENNDELLGECIVWEDNCLMEYFYNKKGLRFNEKNSLFIFLAIEKGVDISTIKLACKLGCILKGDKNGQDLLSCAVFHNRLDCVILFLEEVPDKVTITPMALRLSFEYPYIFNYFLSFFQQNTSETPHLTEKMKYSIIYDFFQK